MNEVQSAYYFRGWRVAYVSHDDLKIDREGAVMPRWDSYSLVLFAHWLMECTARLNQLDLERAEFRLATKDYPGEVVKHRLIASVERLNRLPRSTKWPDNVEVD